MTERLNEIKAIENLINEKESRRFFGIETEERKDSIIQEDEEESRSYTNESKRDDTLEFT